jgi:NAD-dependent deacetylase
MTDYEDTSGRTLYITGAGVSADSGIPTFRGEDGYWTIGSANYTQQEMATRQMYLGNPGQFLVWYYRRFASYRNVPPNDVHRWLAAECNSGRANLITQNIDGLDGRAGNRDYVCIHGRLNMMTAYDDQDALHDAATGVPNIFAPPFLGDVLVPAPWEDVPRALRDTGAGLEGAATDDPAAADDVADDAALEAALLHLCRIRPEEGPRIGVSLKPYVLLFDEYYTDLYRMGTAERWMAEAARMVFIGTSFSVNITAIALRTALQRGIPVEIVDPAPVDLGIPDGMADVTYHRMTAKEWVGVG